VGALRTGDRPLARASASPPGHRRGSARSGSNRDEARSRVRARRRFYSTGSEPPAEDGGDGPIWPAPRQPSSTESHVEWPYWIALIVPWLMLGTAWLLNHLQVCVMCMPDNLPIPGQ